MILIGEHDGLDAPCVFLRLYPEQCTDQSKAKNRVHSCKTNERKWANTDDGLRLYREERHSPRAHQCDGSLRWNSRHCVDIWPERVSASRWQWRRHVPITWRTYHGLGRHMNTLYSTRSNLIDEVTENDSVTQCIGNIIGQCHFHTFLNGLNNGKIRERARREWIPPTFRTPTFFIWSKRWWSSLAWSKCRRIVNAAFTPGWSRGDGWCWPFSVVLTRSISVAFLG